MSNKNPYLPPAGDDSAIDALLAARSLRGVPKDRREKLKSLEKEWWKLIRGEDYNLDDFYALMCDNILSERRRVGGDWVVAQAVPTKKLRDLIKSKLGPDLVFVVLNLKKDHQLERLGPRSATLGEELIKMWMGMKYEPAEENEEKAIDLKITREMELDDVVAKIMEKIR